MQRYKLTIAYDGTSYCGWQRQPDHVAVQQVLETAFRSFCGEDVTIIAAGRTDAGVHASGQVCHVDLSKAWREDVVRDAVIALRELPGARRFCVECQSMESIHNHIAYAYAESEEH